MKLNSVRKLDKDHLSKVAYSISNEMRQHAINKVNRDVCELLLKQLTVKPLYLEDDTHLEYVATAHVYSDERMHEVLREIETLITELRQRDLNGSADALRKVGYMLTSNKF